MRIETGEVANVARRRGKGVQSLMQVRRDSVDVNRADFVSSCMVYYGDGKEKLDVLMR